MKPQKDWVKGVVLCSDLISTGKFESSHAKLNHLQSNVEWGWRGNSLDIPTDCPQRDERAGWTGDAQVFCATSMFNTGAHAFWKSWLSSMRDDQEPDGSIPDIIPGLVHWKNSPGWMDAATIVPWDVYVRSGDAEVLSQNYEMMQKLVEFYRSKSQDGLINELKAYGDWLQPYAKKNEGDTPAQLLATAFYAHSTSILANAAQVLGRDEEAKRYAEEAATIKEAFTNHYFVSSGKLKNAPETQTGYVLAIAFNLIPEKLKFQVAGHLVRLVHEADDHLRTGFLGSPYLTKVLDDNGYPELACKILFRESYPSWLYTVNQGATTMWERWNSYSHEHGFGDTSMNSFNHYAYGAIGQWMYERIAGLTPDADHPGYKHFLVRPLFCEQLDWASAELETPYGKAACEWKKQNGKIGIKVEVPPNTTATFVFSNDQRRETIKPGSHHFAIPETDH